jgi:hypothetical protein
MADCTTPAREETYMIHTDGKRTIANAGPIPCPFRSKKFKRPHASELKQLALQRVS